MKRANAFLVLCALATAAPADAQPARGRSAETARSASRAADELIEADRRFARSASAAATPAAGLSAMFAPDVVFPLPGRGLLQGREEVARFFSTHPSYASGSIDWTPVRVGISADGTQGFTFGFLDLTAGDPGRRARKYLSYWVRRPEGWRVIAYRQITRPAGDVRRETMAPSLPARMPRAAHRDRTRLERGLRAAEQAFSDRAQAVGLRRAFLEAIRDDAMLMGDGPAFLIGPEAIAGAFPEASTSPLRWSSDRVVVAPSGDLGLSIGTLRHNGATPAGEPETIPFFTIWRRDGADAPWRFIAE